VRRVLVVDDEENICLVLRTLLRKHGYDVEVATSAEKALELFDKFGPDFVLADVKMPGMNGIELCAQIKARSSFSSVVVMSAYGSEQLALDAIRAGAYDFMAKPFKQEEVLFMLRKVEERATLRRENQALREAARKQHSFSELLGKSPAMEHVFRTVEKVAEYRTTVLIQGESGTGKELVARALHRLSPRAARPFVAINCGAIPESLIESELFGHKRGAFTDAHADKQGIFQEANGGTLFLDEIGDLPLKLQVKLLRSLQEGKIRKLGDTQDVDIDVRVIAATIRDLNREVEQGRFREDLFYRLNVLQIFVPPLRERTEDIPLLVDHFIEKNNARLGTQIRGLDLNSRKLLMNYHWPGNVRELENLIERAVVLAERDVLTEADLPERLRETSNPMALALGSGELSIKKAVRVIEETLIRRALEKTKGNRTAASKLLEISHRALLYKIKDYGIDDP
jgi:two-component system, NtrC family, response regulator AtoC